MKKKYSIKKNSDIQKVLNKGKFQKCDCCIIYVLKNGTDKNNVAFLAGKKLGKAPIRNKAKRKMRLAMMTEWDYLEKGYDIVILARPYLLNKDQILIEKDFSLLFKKHKIRKIQ